LNTSPDSRRLETRQHARELVDKLYHIRNVARTHHEGVEACVDLILADRAAVGEIAFKRGFEYGENRANKHIRNCKTYRGMFDKLRQKYRSETKSLRILIARLRPHVSYEAWRQATQEKLPPRPNKRAKEPTK
jgi:hypothetical protein